MLTPDGQRDLGPLKLDARRQAMAMILRPGGEGGQRAKADTTGEQITTAHHGRKIGHALLYARKRPPPHSIASRKAARARRTRSSIALALSPKASAASL